jgi:hypothetical protein
MGLYLRLNQLIYLFGTLVLVYAFGSFWGKKSGFLARFYRLLPFTFNRLLNPLNLSLSYISAATFGYHIGTLYGVFLQEIYKLLFWFLKKLACYRLSF